MEPQASQEEDLDLELLPSSTKQNDFAVWSEGACGCPGAWDCGGACGCRGACGSDGKLSGTDNVTEATSVQEPSSFFFSAASAVFPDMALPRRTCNGGGGAK